MELIEHYERTRLLRKRKAYGLGIIISAAAFGAFCLSWFGIAGVLLYFAAGCLLVGIIL